MFKGHRAAGLCVLGLVALIILLDGRSAFAQDDDPRTTSRVRIGPVFISPTVALQDLGVESNVYNSEESVSDFAFTFTPTFLASGGTRRALLTLRSVTDFVYFAEQHSERSVNEDLVARGRFAFRRLTVSAEAGYLNTRQRASEEIDARSRRKNYSGELGVSLAMTPKFSAQVRGQYVRAAFDPNAVFDFTRLAESLNREVRTVSGGIRYAATPITTLAVTADSSRTRFTNAPIRDADSQQTLFGVELTPRALISGSVRLGYQRFRPLHASLPEFDGLVGSVDVAYRFRTSTRFGLSFDRNLSYSYANQEPYYVRQGYGLSIRRQLAPRWDVSASGGRFVHRYINLLVPLSDTLEGRSDRLARADLAVGYQSRPGTRFDVGFSYRDRRSGRGLRSYDALGVGTSVTYGF